MKYLILNYEFPPLGGGAGNATQNIARELVRLGHQITVVTTWFQGLPDEIVIDGYKVIRLHARRACKDRSNIFEMFDYVRLANAYCQRLFMQEKFDHIISFFALPTGLIALNLKKKFGVPYTISLRGGDVPGFLPKNLKWHHLLSMPFTNRVWENASHIIANSMGLKDLAEKTAHRFNKEVACIPNGVNTDVFKPASELNLNPFKILFVGRLTEQKGATYLLKALAAMKDSNKAAFESIQAIIIGDGPLRNSLEAESKSLGVSNHVHFKGWVDRERLPGIFANSSVFVLPTSEEGMPNVVLEAIATGLPVIATDVPGNNEIITSGKNGILVNKTDEFAAVLTDLYSHQDKARVLGKSAREEALKRGWDRIAVEYANLCR